MKHVCLILILLAGCGPTARELAREHDAHAYVAMAMGGGAAPVPVPPGPDPTPGETCTRCNGTGKIKPDGRIEITCPDCGGDGKLASDERMLNALRALVSVSEEQGRIKQRLDDLQQAKPEPANERVVVSSPAASPQPPAAPRADCGCGCADCACGVSSGPCPCKCGRCPANSRAAILPSAIRPPASALDWIDTFAAGKRMSIREGQQALVHFTGGESCRACVIMDEDVFTDPEVIRVLQNFVLVKIDAEQLSPAARREWEAGKIPVDYVINADWTDKRKLGFTLDPAEFAEQLRSAKGWGTGRRTASVQTAGWTSTSDSQPTERIVYVQSGGSAGGTYNGGGSAGGRVYAQPTQYVQPAYYAQPMVRSYVPNYSNSYSGGRTMVCGPGGCYMQ